MNFYSRKWRNACYDIPQFKTPIIYGRKSIISAISLLSIKITGRANAMKKEQE